jgi:oligoendopeptidase F
MLNFYGGFLMHNTTHYHYHSETKTVPVGGDGQTITIINNTPVLNQKERELRKKEIEQRLYNVFSKYKNGGAKIKNSQY